MFIKTQFSKKQLFKHNFQLTNLLKKWLSKELSLKHNFNQTNLLKKKTIFYRSLIKTQFLEISNLLKKLIF